MVWLKTMQKADDKGSTEQESDSFPQQGEEILDCLPNTQQVTFKEDKVQTFALRIQVLVPPPAALPPVGSTVPTKKPQESYGKWLLPQVLGTERALP